MVSTFRKARSIVIRASYSPFPCAMIRPDDLRQLHLLPPQPPAGRQLRPRPAEGDRRLLPPLPRGDGAPPEGHLRRPLLRPAPGVAPEPPQGRRPQAQVDGRG